MEEIKFKSWSNFEISGELTVEDGEMDRGGVIQSLKRMFDKDWQWNLKGLDEYRYVVRFPPTK